MWESHGILKTREIKKRMGKDRKRRESERRGKMCEEK